tara:strand:+ start:1356 stop:2516 length:1161 start_codon:yes stop_codon:yes gene_type:complete
MNVLSLFDGISVARQALFSLDIPVAHYYCCEIDKYAIQISKKNWSDNIHLGNVKDFSNNALDIDLLIGGSPCQDLSIAKKGRKGLEGDRSGLFWEYVRIKDLVNPKFFILENVASMPKKDRDIITEAMGVEPVMFNASLVSAQCRKRLFWTNIKFDLPEDRGILVKDILQNDNELVGRIVNRKLDANGVRKDKQEGLEYTTQIEPNANGKSNCLSTVQKDNVVINIGHIGNSNAQANRVYSVEGKGVSLCANGGGLGAKTGLYTGFTKTAQTGRNETKKLGFVDGIDHQANRVYDVNGKIPALNSICNSRPNTIDLRKLTPIECERLQSLPDDYTAGVSNSQRYKCLGNAFNCEVIAHILYGVDGVSPFYSGCATATGVNCLLNCK